MTDTKPEPFPRKEGELEAELQRKGLNAPRLSPTLINEVIDKEYYHTFPGGITVCCLILKNGFKVIGDSAPVSFENFDENVGKRIAKDKAREKIWELEGYALKQRLFEANPLNTKD